MIIMSAGPTLIKENVRKAMVRDFTNTDLDKEYVAFHRECERKISKVLNTEARSFLMLGEAMLGLDGACSSFLEKGDRALILINGIFSEGFVDFVEMYEGIAVPLRFDLRGGIDVEILKNFLKNDHDFKICYMVHCETPSGISNDIHEIGPVLNEYGILTVVDSVSAIAGEHIDFDRSKVDCIIGGTQKCFSAPAGLTTITLSDRAVRYLEERKTPVAGFYSNFRNYLTSGEFDFPYTPCDNLVYAFDEACNDVLSHDFAGHHRDVAERTRRAVEACGLEIYARNYRSNTVTTVLMPEGKSSHELMDRMMKKGFLIAGGMGILNDKAFRIGHMGSNISDMSQYEDMLRILNKTLVEMGIHLNSDLYSEFIR